jgi:hypothetical protein
MKTWHCLLAQYHSRKIAGDRWLLGISKYREPWEITYTAKTLSKSRNGPICIMQFQPCFPLAHKPSSTYSDLSVLIDISVAYMYVSSCYAKVPSAYMRFCCGYMS